MKPGKKFSVRLKFEYQLSKSLEGFYLSTYKDQNGNEKLVENLRKLFLYIFCFIDVWLQHILSQLMREELSRVLMNLS